MYLVSSFERRLVPSSARGKGATRSVSVLGGGPPLWCIVVHVMRRLLEVLVMW